MGKVVTSEGLTEFVQTGKHEVIAPDKPEKAKAPPQAAPPPEEKAETKAETPPPPEPDEGLEDEDKQLSEAIRKKIGKKHRAMKEAQEAAAESERFAEQQFNERKLIEQRAAQLEAKIKDYEAKQAPPPEPELKAPDETDAKYQKDGQFQWKAFSEDLAEFKAKQSIAEYEKKQAEAQRQKEVALIDAQFKDRLEQAMKKYPDFEKVMQGTDSMLQQSVLQYIYESDSGLDVAYFLAQHPDDVARIAKLPPIRAIAEVGKLESKLVEPKGEVPAPEAPRAQAPPPITPISAMGAGTVKVNPRDMTFQQLRAYERERNRRR